MNKTPQNGRDDENLGSFYVGRQRVLPEQKRVLPRGALTFIALLAFAAVIWYAYPDSEETSAGADVPVVTADSAAYKFKPEDPGGIEVPHQDSTVFDPLEKKTAGVEKLRPKAEQPLAKDTALAKAPLDKAEPKLNLDLQMKEVAAGTEKIVTKTEPAKAATPKPVEKPAAKTADKTPARTAPAATAASSAGAMYIQLGSYRDAAGAKTDWEKLRQKYPQLLSGLSMRTQRVDLGEKGVFNRLQAGTLSESRAAEICATLKTANPGGCILVR